MRTGRPASRPGGRPHTVATRLSEAETAFVDASRGYLSRGEWLRMLILREKRSAEAEEKPAKPGDGV